MARARPSIPCPHCGAPVRRGARACRECGSDARTGWSDEADLPGLELPTGYGVEDDFDYESWLREQVGGLGGRPWWRRPTLWRRLATATLVVLLVLLLILAGA